MSGPSGGDAHIQVHWQMRSTSSGMPSTSVKSLVEKALVTSAGDPVADVTSAFSTSDFTLVDGIPLDVLRICQWTWMCASPPLGPDIHPNTAGYGVIAQAFKNALP